jgi:uncharacterized membrane protein
MKTIRGEYLILIGFVMVMLGAILPFLILMKMLESTFFLDFFSYISSVMGLFLGIMGSAYVVRYHRRKKRDNSEPPETMSDHHQDW